MTRGWPSWHRPGRSCGSSTAPGNVHHSKGAERFVRELIGEIRAHLGRRALTLEFRMDAAFFQQHLLKLLNRRGGFYAVKVPWCRWTGVKALSARPIALDGGHWRYRLLRDPA
jgi:hypothetical protein